MSHLITTRLLKIISGVVLCLFLTESKSIALQSSNIDYTYIVAQDGSGDFTTIQDAIDGSRSFPPERVTIFIKEGIYKEKVKVHSWNTKLSMIGEDKDNTIITYDDYFDKIDRGRNSTFHTYNLLVQGNDFMATNITVENSAGPVGQANALHVEADRSLFRNCKFLGQQDTIYAAGEGSRQFFDNCYVEGTTDFIFGGATAIFNNCIIHSKSDSYITAASTPEGIEFGFVFMNSTLTADPGVESVYLGRPWRDNAKTVFLNTEMGSHIHPGGWHNWNRDDAEETVFYAENNNYGLGSQPEHRSSWTHQLIKSEAEKYSMKNIFNDWYPFGSK